MAKPTTTKTKHAFKNKFRHVSQPVVRYISYITLQTKTKDDSILNNDGKTEVV